MIIATFALRTVSSLFREEPDDHPVRSARRGHRHPATSQRRAAALLGLVAWIIGLIFITPVLCMLLTSLAQRGGRGDQPARLLRAAHAGGLPNFFGQAPAPAPGRL